MKVVIIDDEPLISDKLKRIMETGSRALVVLGGLHASLSAQEAVGHADFVLLGEGDESIRDLLAALSAGERPGFPGLAWRDESGAFRTTGPRRPPCDISTIPDRSLVYRYREMAGHNTLWPQVHASRGCPHNCDYCAVVRHFGHRVRTRPPENVVEEIRQAIAFHDRPGRLLRVLWLTDDNFFADRGWAMSVLRAIRRSGIRCAFTVQARFEVGSALTTKCWICSPRRALRSWCNTDESKNDCLGKG